MAELAKARPAAMLTADRDREDLLVPVFMTLDPILEACLARVLHWFPTGRAVNSVSCMSCALGCMHDLRLTLTAASNGTRLCYLSYLQY